MCCRYSGSTTFQRRGSEISGSALFNLPDEYGINFNHQGDMKQFQNSGVLKVAGVSYTGSSEFSNSDGNWRGATSLRLPEEYGVNFKHDGDMLDFNNEGSLTYGNTKYTGRTRFSKKGNRMSGGASINVPEEYSVSFKHQGDSDAFTNEGAVTLGGRTYTGQTEYNNQGRKMNGKAQVNIPEEYSMSFSHQGDRDAFRNDGSVTLGDKTYTGQTEYSNQGRKVTGRAQVNLPEEYSVRFNHDGDMESFTNDGVLTVADRRYTGQTEFSRDGAKLNGKAQVNVPEEYSVRFQHEGDLDSFTSDGALTLAERRYTGQTQFNRRGRRMNGKAQVNLPEEYGITFNHQGNMDQFTNDGSLTVADKKYTGQTEFNRRGSRLGGKAQVNLPEEYSVSFDHKGNAYDFSNSGTLKVDSNTYSGESSYKKVGDKVEAAASVSVPSKYGFQFSHTGGLREFANSGEIKINGKTYSGSTDFRLDNSGIEGRVSMRVPDEYEVRFKHQGPITRFNNEGSIKMPGREISASSEFTKNGNNLAGQATIRLPEEYGISFNHQGPLTSFSNEATLRTPERTITGNSQFKLQEGNKVDALIRFNLPREYSLEFNHEGELTNFNNKATVTYANRKYSGLSEFLMKGKKAEGRVVVRVPDMYSVKFQHRGGLFDFSNEAMVKANNQKYTAGSEFRMDGNTIRGTANVRIPEEYKFTFSHNGAPTDFNTNAEAILDEAAYTAGVVFKKSDEGIESTGQVTTPHRQARSLEYRYSHQGDLSNFKQDVYGSVNDQRLSAKTEYQLNGKALTGRLELATPFDAARTALVELSHEGKWKNFKNSLVTELNNQRYTANGEMKLFGKKKQGSFVVNIPQEYGFDFIHKGASLTDWTNKATASIGEDKINVNSGLTIEAGNVEAVLSVRTPYRDAKDFGFSITHKGNAKKFNTMAEVTTPFRTYKRFSGDLSFEGNARSFQTNGKIQTPFDIAPEMNFEMNHRGQLNNYASSAAVELGNKRIAGNTAYRKYGKNLEASANLDTPWRDMGFALTHNGEDNGFNTNLKVDAPLKEYKTFAANLNHQGTLKNFQTSAKLETPFQSMPVVNLALNHRGDTRDFTTSGSVEYGTKRMEGQASYKRTSDWYDGSHVGSIRVKTPFKMARNVDISAEHHSRSDSLSGKLEITHNGQKYVDGDYTLETAARKNLVFNIREPQPIAASFAFEKKNGGAEMISLVNWDTRNPTSNGRAALTWGRENNRYFSNGEFLLANVPSSKMMFEVESSVSSRRSQDIYDGRVKVDSALAEFEGTFNHVHSPGRRYVTEVRLGQRQPIRIQSEVLLNNGVKATLTLGHPSYSNVSFFRFLAQSILQTSLFVLCLLELCLS